MVSTTCVWETASAWGSALSRDRRAFWCSVRDASLVLHAGPPQVALSALVFKSRRAAFGATLRHASLEPDAKAFPESRKSLLALSIGSGRAHASPWTTSHSDRFGLEVLQHTSVGIGT